MIWSDYTGLARKVVDFAERLFDARLAAFWHRSELSTRDVTPLEPEEAAMKHALVAEAKRRRGGAN